MKNVIPALLECPECMRGGVRKQWGGGKRSAINSMLWRIDQSASSNIITEGLKCVYRSVVCFAVMYRLHLRNARKSSVPKQMFQGNWTAAVYYSFEDLDIKICRLHFQQFPSNPKQLLFWILSSYLYAIGTRTPYRLDGNALCLFNLNIGRVKSAKNLYLNDS